MMKMKKRRDRIQQIGGRVDLYEKQDNQSKLIGESADLYIGLYTEVEKHDALAMWTFSYFLGKIRCKIISGEGGLGGSYAFFDHLAFFLPNPFLGPCHPSWDASQVLPALFLLQLWAICIIQQSASTV